MNPQDRQGVLGVDVGGVIIDRIHDGTDTSFFGGNYLETTAVPDAFSILTRLRAHRFRRVILVSKCGGTVEAKTRHWLEHYNFFGRTRIDPKDAFFCRKRRDKLAICRDEGVTHFVDDRLEILSYLVGTVPELVLFRANEKEVAAYEPFLPHVARADTWSEVERRWSPA